METMNVGNRSLLEIAEADTYEEAQNLVDRLARDSFPIERLAIVGRDPELVELIVGRWDAWKAALTGAVGTAILGSLFALLFGVWLAPNGIALLSYALYFGLVGAVVGAFFGALSHALSSGSQRAFASAAVMVATSYALMADELVADDALLRLRRMVGDSAPTATRSTAAAAFGGTPSGPTTALSPHRGGNTDPAAENPPPTSLRSASWPKQ
jgi:hypothetical protein